MIVIESAKVEIYGCFQNVIIVAAYLIRFGLDR